MGLLATVYTRDNADDDRNEEIVTEISKKDVIILTGGHVPAQNLFLKKIALKEKLWEYRGLVIAHIFE